jgi:micrococcal nuclease
MDDLFFILFLISIVALLIGRRRPEWVRMSSARQATWVFGTLAFVVVVVGSSFTDVEPARHADTGTGSETVRAEDVGAVPEAFAQGEQGAPSDEAPAKVEDLGAAVAAERAGEEGTSAPIAKTPEGDLFDVVGVVDGDTIKVSIGATVETLRLIGIDTPETKDPRKPVQCFGEEATRKATELLTGKRVRLEADTSQGERDKYGRLLRYVWREDGLFFNEWMIRNGYAFEYTYNTPYQYQASFKEAQRYASENNLGLWNPSTCDGEASAVEAVGTAPVVPVGEGGGHTFYTSSHSSAKYYYCDTDEQWKGLSTSYLKSFPSETELRAAHPSRTLHEACEEG